MRHFKFTDMRRHKLNRIWIILLGLFVGSCEDYLDRSPDDGLSEDDVYKDYSSLLGFMDRIFQNGDILIFTHGINSYSNTYVTVGNLSDEYASVRDNDPSKFVNVITSHHRINILSRMFGVTTGISF